MIDFETEADEQFAEDILSMVSEKPILFNELVDGLRGNFMQCNRRPESKRRWKNVRAHEVEAILESFGAFFRSRKHGAGSARYVATEDFSTVLDGRCRVKEVY